MATKKKMDFYIFMDVPLSHTANILIITRSTGRRGLDMPQADYAILYSPKTDEYVVWQELSRIRSTLTNSKPSYILCYDKTTEQDRLYKLQADMENSRHHYTFSNWNLLPGMLIKGKSKVFILVKRSNADMGRSESAGQNQHNIGG
jgi:hypothetical protein